MTTENDEKVYQFKPTAQLEEELGEILSQIDDIENDPGRIDVETAKRRAALVRQRDSLQAKLAKTRSKTTADEMLMRAKAAAKEELQAAKLAEREEMHRQKVDDVARVMAENGDHFYFLLTSNAFLQVVNGSLNFFKAASLATVEAGFEDKEWRVLWKQTLKAQSRVFLDVAFSYKPLPPTTLNLTDRSVWLTPKLGTPHPVFDHLLDSLSGGKQVNRDHIEQCCRWKYMHPEDFLLPCLTIYGEGSIGKNLFVTATLASLFSERQVNALRSQSVTGRFNESLLGKTVVFIDESVADKANMDALKQLVNNPTIDIDKKFVNPIVCHNTAWYIIGGNKAPITLADDKSDRRWSVVKAQRGRTLHRVIAIREGFVCEADAAKLNRDSWRPYEQQAKVWLDTEAWRLSDPEEVAIWLYSILDRWQGEKSRPNELHGDDHKELLGTQEKSWKSFAKSIFLEREPRTNPLVEGGLIFRHIKRLVYCEMYREYHSRYYTGRCLGKGQLYSETDALLQEWAQEGIIDISKKTFTVLQGSSTDNVPERTTMECWFNAKVHKNSPSTIDDNETIYKFTDQYGRVTWYFRDAPDAESMT